MRQGSARLRRWLAAGVVLPLAALAGTTPVRASTGLEGVPGYDHVIVLILENEGYTTTFGPGSPAHYLNTTLVPQSVLDDQYFGIGHASLDNYISMTSAQPPYGTTDADCLSMNLYDCAQVQYLNPTYPTTHDRNIGDQLDAAALTWKGYMDSMPSACYHADYSPAASPDTIQGNSQAPPAKDYADRHNPFLYYPDIVGNTAQCAAHDVPYTQLAGDLTSGLPSYSFITPDTCHDGHDTPCSNGSAGGLASADAWLSTNVPPLLTYVDNPANNALLLLTFDEAGSSDTSGCCHGGPAGQQGFGGRVGLLAFGAHLKPPGTVVHTPYDHASQLRTVEDGLGISEHLNDAGASSPMLDLFASPAGGVFPEVPTPLLLPLLGAGAAAVPLILRRGTRPAT